MPRTGRDRIPSSIPSDANVREGNREGLCADQFVSRSSSRLPAASRELRFPVEELATTSILRAQAH